MTALGDAKRAARAAALAAREAVHRDGAGSARLAAGHALEEIARLRDVGCVSAYLPVRNEIDPRPVMLSLFGLGYRICVPIIEGRGRPLRFRAWTPGVELVAGPYEVPMPASGEWLEPQALLVPMLAFDRRGHRLGYGGGFYDRTIEGLRARGEVHCFGFAYAAQEIPEVPDGGNDMRLDAIITEAGVMRPA
jgi:5-formyltetrahydrofolate cyclo-ligase